MRSNRPAFALTAGALLGSLLTSGCAGSSQGATTTVQAPAAVSRSVLRPAPQPETDFLSTEAASEAAEFIRLGRESMRDSIWFEAAQHLDSAMTHLAVLETAGNLTPRQLESAALWRDSVREWLVESVSQLGSLGGAEDLSDYLDHEIEEVSLASMEDLEALLARLPDRDFALPIPNPVPHSVLQAMRVFTGSGRGYFEKWLQRRNRYESLIHGKLDERGMPRDLLYLSMIESGFNPKAWSHASASGLWQFISGTGRRYGLKDDWWEDPRRDPVRATDAALDYLEDLYADFGDWHLAMAAYNCGEGRVRRHLRADPGQTYWDMSLPKETRYYVPKILAAMIIGRNPAVFGFNTTGLAHAPLSYDTATVTRSVSLKGIAEAVGVSEDSIKNLNPALRRWGTPPGRALYTVYLPEGTRDLFYANVDGLQAQPDVSLQSHRVSRGQTLSAIAARYGVSMSSIQDVNGLRGTRLRIGQVLTIPVPGASHDDNGPISRAAVAVEVSRHTVRPGETLSGIAGRYRVPVSALRQANGMRPGSVLQAGRSLTIPVGGRDAASVDNEVVAASHVSSPTSAGARRVHTVRSGETLSGIAARLGVTQASLRDWNGLSGSRIRAGQKLVYRSAGEAMLMASNGEYYRVRSGDNLWAISSRFGNTVDDLKRMNDGLSEDLQPGQRIRVR